MSTIEQLKELARASTPRVMVDGPTLISLCERMPEGHLLRSFAKAHKGREKPLEIARSTLVELLEANGYALPVGESISEPEGEPQQ